MIEYNLLIKKLVNNEISLKEREILEEWILIDKKNLKLFTQTIKELEGKENQSFDSDIAYNKFIASISKKDNTVIRLTKYYKYAAVLVIAICLGFIIFPNNKSKDSSNIVNLNLENNILDKKAITIKLADGTTKIITNNKLADLKDSKGNIIASKQNNSLSFTNDLKNNSENLILNEIYVPNGKTLKIKLTDGTVVWLNSGTRFKFPQSFSSYTENRKVFLQGEAFFDVTKNKDKPFIVETKGINVEVLGTQFNVSSYNNEETIATTLVEGLVNVIQAESPDKKLQITPNYQAVFNTTNSSFSKAIVDTKIYTSWINNKLIINNLKFNDILKKLERKYDVEIVNENQILNNEINRGEFEDETIETILNTIALSNPFNYTIEGKKITITK
jgi:hypothetical protein